MKPLAVPEPSHLLLSPVGKAALVAAMVGVGVIVGSVPLHAAGKTRAPLRHAVPAGTAIVGVEVPPYTWMKPKEHMDGGSASAGPQLAPQMTGSTHA